MAKTNRTSIQLPFPIDGATVEIPLTKGYVAIVDAADGDLAFLRWYAAETVPGYVYAQRKPKDKHINLHNIVLERKLGRNLTPDERGDHVNGNTLDCRRTNLRPATHQQNMQNRRRSVRNRSGVAGVHWNKHKQKWRVRIRANGKTRDLGDFKSLERAAEVRRKAEVKYYGEFAPNQSRNRPD